MLSLFASYDFEDFEKAGVVLNPADIIRLNELGLRMEKGAKAADIIACPRIGWAGDIPIHEPTLQSESWMYNYAANWFDGDDNTLTACLLFACAHATIKGFFQSPEMLDKSSVIEAIKAWHESLTVTANQLRIALEYALYGCDSGSDIYPEPSDRVQDNAVVSESELTEEDYRQYAIDEAIAAGLGLPLEDIKLLTESRLYSVLKNYNRNKGFGVSTSNTKAQAEYARTLAAIKRKYTGVENG